MIASLLIGLREGLEAAIIIGLTIGVLTKIGRREYRATVWYGVAAATFVSLGAALILQLLGARFEGRAEEIFEGLMMFLAASVLTWMIFWMQRMSRQVQQGLEIEVRSAAMRGHSWGLFGISFLAVLREGVETALFLTATAMTTSPLESLFGGLIGILISIILGWAIFASTIRLDLHRFFQVTSTLLILFAAGLFAHGIHEFNEAGIIPGLIDPLWDINPILNEQSFVGRILQTLFGYNGNPTLTEVLAYFGYYLVILLGIRGITRKMPVLVKAEE
jgi:high-affinity iron transporter